MSHDPVETPKVVGLMAEFDSPEAILHAAETIRDKGYKQLEAFTPFPVHGLSEATGFRDNRMLWLVFLGGLVGGSSGLLLQTYVSVYDYPLNVGGKPLFSLPSFIPITFECTVLLAAASAFFGMLAMNRLPQPYHSVFNVPEFARATQDRFFLLVPYTDPNYDEAKTRADLQALKPLSLSEVEP